MKKLSILAVAALFTMGLVSCKKDYTCKCTASGASYSYDYGKQKKGDATDACDAQETTWKLVDASASCELD